jgi:acetyl-CoA acetyltransferase
MNKQAPLAAVIVGIGESAVGRVPHLDALGLQRMAALAALEDAGLEFADIDGLLTTPIRVENWAMPCGVVSENLGVHPRYMATLDVAGASAVGMAHHAAMAVATGQCETVLCVAGQNMLSFSSQGAAVQKLADAGWAHPQFEAPYGPLVPTLYALVAQRHMDEYGTTLEQMAEVAVTMRKHAALNPNAHKKDPISIADVMQSRMITSPLRMLDCALVSDGAAAFIVTTPERARDLRQSQVKLLGHGYGHSHTYIGDYKNITTTGAVQSGRDAFDMAGLSPSDIDVAELYDCFTITVIVELEDLGFCAKGEGGQFVENGGIALGGKLPVTTHGGLLSGGHPGLAGGMFHLLEGVRQVRNQAGERQVPGAEVALVHGNGGIVGLHSSLIIAKV